MKISSSSSTAQCQQLTAPFEMKWPLDTASFSDKYDKVEQLYLSGYQIQSKAFQPHHGSIPSTIKHLVLLYKKQGKYAEAGPL
ncbi:kinesin light chain 3-like isoform X4 [Acropora muricata]|uniref:kinesin light chain 3-like isoform X4 n=1 Tax=Acropora muricata TaxID=159855 RepID=UPI0034E56332